MAKKSKKTAEKSPKTKKSAKSDEARSPGRPRDERTVDQLLAALEETTDADEKRRLRAKLRARGHTGGLRKEGE